MAETAKSQENEKADSTLEEPGNGAPGRENHSVKPAGSNNTLAAQDFHRLMEAFTNEIKLAVPCDGIKFRANNINHHFVAGILDHYLCCFAIKVDEKSFGTIYFARETQFMESELTILENMVAGLVLPLCQLFQAEISHENRRGSDVDDEPFSISAADCLQNI